MSPKLMSAYRRNAGLLVLLACITLAAGCATHHEAEAPAPATTVASSAGASGSNADEGPSPPITAGLPELPPEGTEVVVTQPTAVVNASAPRSYTVKRGDTLWGLSNMFLRDPWLWPEIWYVNPQINNPHLIYPGDVLTLVQGRDGSVSQIQLTRGPVARLSPTLRNGGVNANGTVATVPYDTIRTFLSRPGIITSDEIRNAPYVMSIRDAHLVGGLNNDLYVRGSAAASGERYNVMHIGQPLYGGNSHKQVGYMAVYAGSVQISRTGEPATARVTESAREILIGDLLVPNAPIDTAAIVPHPPAHPVDTLVVAVTDGVNLVGSYKVIALGAGSAQGLEVGHVLRAWSTAKRANDHCRRINGVYDCNHDHYTPLPAEIAGTLLVFKVYEQVSYALVVAVDEPVRINDHVSNP
jgi:LysM repeat protein